MKITMAARKGSLLPPPGDLVLDPFAGSGSTAVAAAFAGRDYFGIELELVPGKISSGSLRNNRGELLIPGNFPGIFIGRRVGVIRFLGCNLRRWDP